jgi:putative redox protein
MSVSIDIRYKGDLKCQATHGPSSKKLATEAPVDNGGKGEEFSPTDLVATALGTCILTIMGIVADRNDIALAGAKVEVVKEMASQPVRRIGALTVTVTVPESLQLSDADKAKLENAAHTCPVKQSLHPDVDVRIKFLYSAE